MFQRSSKALTPVIARRDSVVKVANRNTVGSGFVWQQGRGKRKVILTCNHCLGRGASNPSVVTFFRGQQALGAFVSTVLWRCPSKDVAALAYPPRAPLLKGIVVKTSLVEATMQIWSVGSPAEGDQAIHSSRVQIENSTEICFEDKSKMSGLIVLDNCLSPGMSGGPSLNDEGEAVGMAMGRGSPQCGLVMPGSIVLKASTNGTNAAQRPQTVQRRSERLQKRSAVKSSRVKRTLQTSWLDRLPGRVLPRTPRGGTPLVFRRDPEDAARDLRGTRTGVPRQDETDSE